MHSDQWFEFKAWLTHQLHAAGPHGVHSPFVYRLITEILRMKNLSAVHFDVETRRAELMHSDECIDVADYGAGSRSGKQALRKVSSIARTALQSSKHARALCALAQLSHARYILELGTSLGITTCYLSRTAQVERVYTIEGAPASARLAQEGFEAMNCRNVDLRVGEFDQMLEATLRSMPRVDFVIIDGNHRLEPTVKYVQTLLPFMHENSLVVLDDIHWSPGMQEAWQHCIALPQVTLSLDFFDFGVLYFLGGRRKEHFVLKRPWL